MMVQNFRNIFILLIVSFLFIACTNKNSIYSLDNKVLNLGKDSNSIVSIAFNNAKVQKYTARCVLDSYTLTDNNIKYGDLFIESISLDTNCDWRGLPLGFFESNINQSFKPSSFEVVENIELSGYNFKTYRVNGDSFLNIIYIFTEGKDRFILDYKGILHDKLLKTFKVDYTNKFLTKKRFLGSYNDSLVRKNISNNYFENTEKENN